MSEVDADDWDRVDIIRWVILLGLGVVILTDYFLSGRAGGHVAQDVGVLVLVFGSLLGLYFWTWRGRRR